jgi:hypothetical protein
MRLDVCLGSVNVVYLRIIEMDEKKILDEMYKAFKTELRMTREQVDDEMLNFDGTLSEFYYYIYNKR